jgi:hypothetical protein
MNKKETAASAGLSSAERATRPYKNSRFAGEMLVAAELSRLGFEVMLGNVGGHNTEGYDLAAACPVTGVIAGVSVKSLKTKNPFYLDPENVVPKAVYAFVITGPAGRLPQFFVIRGETLLADEATFWGKYGRNYEPASHRGIQWKALVPYTNNWAALDVA